MNEHVAPRASTPFSLTAVVTEFPAPSQTFILRKVLGLRDAGVDVTVAASTLGHAAEDVGVGLLQLTPWHDLRGSLAPRNRAAWGATLRGAVELGGARSDRGGLALRERVALGSLLASDADVVHFEFSGIAVTYRKVLERLRPARLAVSCRGAAEQIVPRADPRRGPLLEEVFGAVDLIHCVSDDLRRTALELGAPAERIVVNRPAVPVAAFALLAQGRTPDPDRRTLRVLSIGRLHWKKGFDDAVRAMAELARRGCDVDYRIAGEGAEREKLSFLLDELDLRGSTTLLGTCTTEQIHEQLRWADVLLLPSLSEGISNAVLEAMAAGLPVVSTTCGGMREVIEHEVDGFLVDVGDTTAMADHLHRLASDADLRDRIGRAAAARAVAEFDLSRQVRVFLEAYRGILDA